MKLFAFWKHDSFPYLLGGTISKWCEKDYPGKDFVETEEFGLGCYFRPVKVMPVAPALEILSKLNKLKKQYEEELKDIHNEYDILLKEELKKSHITGIK